MGFESAFQGTYIGSLTNTLSAGQSFIVQNGSTAILTLTAGSPNTAKLGVGLQVYAGTASLSSLNLLSAGTGPNVYISTGADQTLHLNSQSGAAVLGLGDAGMNATKAFVSYNNIPTVGFGVGAQYGLDSRTGLSAADGSAITLYAVPAAGGLFKISASADITVSLTAAGTYTVSYTDINGTVRTLVPMNAQTAQGHYTVAPADGVWVKGSTNITAQLTGAFGTTSRCNVYASVVEYQ